MADRSQLQVLATPFPAKYVHTNPSGGGSYVAHDVVTQRLLFVFGGYDFEVRQILRGHVEGKAPNPNGSSERARRGTPDLDDVIVGAVCRLTVVLDGVPHYVEEVGDCESPHNWTTDGQRMKDAMSDAIKRCAMRLGCGLHLWAQDEYVLDQWLRSQVTPPGSQAAPPASSGGSDAPPAGTSPDPAEGATQQVLA